MGEEGNLLLLNNKGGRPRKGRERSHPTAAVPWKQRGNRVRTIVMMMMMMMVGRRRQRAKILPTLVAATSKGKLWDSSNKRAAVSVAG